MNQLPIKTWIQPQFKLLSDNYRELALYSGRGAGKSWAVAEYLVIMAYSQKLRILCTREVQNSIADSVLKLLSDTIHRYGLSQYFDIQRSAIYCTESGSEFIFKGIARNAHSIKSMENINICWLEEAQTTSKESLEILLPTIFRNKGAKVIYTYNPRTSADAVYVRFHGEVLPLGAIVKKFDWRDNRYFSEAMREEMEFAKKHDPEMAMHIWEGELCPSPNDIAVIPLGWLMQCVDAHLKLKLKLPDGCKYVGLDFADGGSDKSALALRQGPLLIDAFEFEEKYVNQSVARANSYAKLHGAYRVHFDSIGIGAGAKGDFNRIAERDYIAMPHIGSASPAGKDYKFTDNMTNGQFFRNLKAQAWWNIRLKVENTLRLLDGEQIDPAKCFFISGKIPKRILEKLLMELGQASYTHEDGKLMVDKQPDDQSSPNMADAVVMAFVYDAKAGLKAR